MELQKKPFTTSNIKITAEEDGAEIGRAYLYILKNDQHEEPYGFMEDVFVEESHRQKGIGSKLIGAVIVEARKQGCYKLICTARSSKPEVHSFYEKFGLRKWGSEFRLDFK